MADIKEKSTGNFTEKRLESQNSRSDESLDLNVKLANPLRQWTREDLIARAKAFAVKCEREDLQEEFAKGAIAAAYPNCEYRQHRFLVVRSIDDDLQRMRWNLPSPRRIRNHSEGRRLTVRFLPSDQLVLPADSLFVRRMASTQDIVLHGYLVFACGCCARNGSE